jgi:hypothetical protein
VWRSEMRDLDFQSPAGAPVTVKRELTGERYSVTFLPDQLGFYTLGAPRPLYAFGINTSPEEADLRPLEKDALPTEFAAERDAHFVAGSEDFEERASRCSTGSYWRRWVFCCSKAASSCCCEGGRHEGDRP